MCSQTKRVHNRVHPAAAMLDLFRWTSACPGIRVVVRHKHPHPGATLDAFEIRDGYRYQAFTLNTPGWQLAFLDARHRAHARVEDRIRTDNDTGIGHLPSRHAHINEVWLELALIAADLLARTQTVLLTDQPDLQRCGVCQPRCPRSDQGEGRRRGRDLGLLLKSSQVEAARVTCRAGSSISAAYCKAGAISGWAAQAGRVAAASRALAITGT